MRDPREILSPWQLDAVEAIRAAAEPGGWAWWICGSAAMAIHGMPREVRDLDVCILPPPGSDPLPALRAIGDARGWAYGYFRDQSDRLRAVHLYPGPRLGLDVFTLGDDEQTRRWAGSVVDAGGFPVEPLSVLAEAKRRWAEVDRQWPKHAADLAEIEAAIGRP